MKIAVMENTEVSSPFNDGCMTMVGLGSFPAPGGWLLLWLNLRTAGCYLRGCFSTPTSPCPLAGELPVWAEGTQQWAGGRTAVYQHDLFCSSLLLGIDLLQFHRSLGKEKCVTATSKYNHN